MMDAGKVKCSFLEGFVSFSPLLISCLGPYSCRLVDGRTDALGGIGFVGEKSGCWNLSCSGH